MDINLKEPKVADWLQNLTEAGCKVGEIKTLSSQVRPNGELLFAYLHADITAPEGYKLLPIIFLRGHAVLVVVQVICKESGEKSFLMVEQRRIATGRVNLEFPAGMLDRDVKNPGFVAVKELFEETGIEVDQKELIPLADRLLYSTPGACDEGIWFYGAQVELTEIEMEDLHGRVRINESENERIRVVLRTEEEFLEQSESLQAMLAFHLFKKKFSTVK